MTRDLLFSSFGHALLLLIAAAVTSRSPVRDMRRPPVIAVRLPPAGEAQPQPRPEKKQAEVVEPKPKAQSAPKPATQPKPVEQQNQVRRFGLGVNIEGAEALGYSYYLTRMLEMINANWLNPYAGQAISRSATIVFLIERDGVISDVRIEKSSGDRAYDLSCERAVKVTEKLPPLPADFAGPRLKLHLEFEQKP